MTQGGNERNHYIYEGNTPLVCSIQCCLDRQQYAGIKWVHSTQKSFQIVDGPYKKTVQFSPRNTTNVTSY